MNFPNIFPQKILSFFANHWGARSLRFSCRNKNAPAPIQDEDTLRSTTCIQAYASPVTEGFRHGLQNFARLLRSDFPHGLSDRASTVPGSLCIPRARTLFVTAFNHTQVIISYSTEKVNGFMKRYGLFVPIIPLLQADNAASAPDRRGTFSLPDNAPSPGRGRAPHRFP